MKSQMLSPVPHLSGRLELEMLESLPCGCVAAAYRALPWSFELVRLEAKGPHCRRMEHSAGNILSLADPPDLDE